MIPPKPAQLRIEDYPTDQRPLLKRLFETLNPWTATVTQALAKGLTRSDNFSSVLRTITFTTAAAAADTFPQQMKNDLAVKPVAVYVGRLHKRSGAITATWSFTWDLDSKGNIQVTFQGLENSTAYSADIVVE